MRQLFLLFSTLLMACSLSSRAQQNNNVVVKAQQYASEVFQDCGQYAQSQYLPDYEDILNRMEIVTTATYNSTNYTLLSAVLLKNKCNPNIVRDDASNFDPNNFNPLKYNLNYFPKGSDKAYRVDGTSYIIIIHHVN